MSEIRKIGTDGRVAPVAELQAQPPASAPPSPVAAVKARRGRYTRPLLLFGVPLLVVLFSCYAYLHAGRFVDTNNAYVKADKAIIAAEVNGKIVEVAVRENDHVESGQLLFRLDDTPYKFALDRAEAALAQTAQDIAATKLQYKQALAEIELAQNNVAYARVTYDRQVGLVDRKIGSISDLDDAKHALDTALKQQELASQRAAKILVDLNGDADVAVEAHPRYQQARSDRDQAALDLQRTNVVAPFSGVASKKPEIGTYVERGNAVMSLVSDGDMWVEANFKETDLTYLRPNQSVEVRIDTYPGFEWQGTVQSVSEATGSEFALLPAQNATGNWVKVVQRVAVHITLHHGVDDPPLRSGMSATVTVDTGHTRTFRDLLPG
jgi:membrane fusion protein (multidrug efflux system)